MTRSRAILQHPLFRIAAIAAVIGLQYVAPVTFPWKVPLFAAVGLVIVWAQTGGAGAAGFRRVRVLPTLAIAVGLAVFVVLGISNGIMPIISDLLGVENDYSAYGPLEGNLEWALKLLAGAMLSAALAEEVVYRGFLLHEADALFGGGTVAKVVAVIAGAALFALPHASQGPTGMISIALVGVTFGTAFFAFGRNLWALIIAHALVDIWGVMQIYLGNVG